MPSSTDFVSLEVGGEALDVWSTYKVDSDLMTPADGFSFEVQVAHGADRLTQRRFAEYREKLSPNAEVRLYVGDDVTGRDRNRYLQLTGYVDEVEIDNSRDGGTTLRVNGRDKAALLTDSSVQVGLLTEDDSSFTSLVERVVQPWGIRVITDFSASRDVLTGRHVAQTVDRLQAEEARAQGIDPERFSRLQRRRADREGRPVDEAAGTTASDRARSRTSNGLVGSDVRRITHRQAAPQAGETAWDFLERHAARLGLMMWMTPRGELHIGAPRYRQDPLYAFTRKWVNDPAKPNSILSGSRRLNGGDRYSEVLVYGRARGGDAARSTIRAVLYDELPFERRLVVHDNSIRSQDEADRRAQREVTMRQADADVLEYELANHGMGRYLYAIDTMAAVDDEVVGARGAWYVTRRTFMRSRDGGTTTRVRLVPEGAIVL